MYLDVCECGYNWMGCVREFRGHIWVESAFGVLVYLTGVEGMKVWMYLGSGVSEMAYLEGMCKT